MYSDKIMQAFANPKNVGIIKGADGVGEATNDLGEVVKIFISVEKNIIVDAKFKAYGGVLVIAGATTLTAYIKNKSLDESVETSTDLIVDMLGGDVEEDKKQSISIAKDAMLMAIKNYRDKLEQE